MKFIYLTLTLLPLAIGLTFQEDDLVFDDISEEASPAPTFLTHHEENELKNRKTKKYKQIEKFWGIPDTTATVGHIFKLQIPKQAFSGAVDHYEIRGNNEKALPHWLSFDEAAFTILGIPAKKDEGKHHISVKAYGKHGGVAEDTFTIQVVKTNNKGTKYKNNKNRCDESEEQTIMTILLDANFEKIKSKIKVKALQNLAGFLGLQASDFAMYARSNKEKNSSDKSTVIMDGPGNVKRRKEKALTCIEWKVGCDGRLWKHQADIAARFHEQAKDGTLSEVLQLPVLLWWVKSDSSDLLRNRRETGSGDYGNNDNDDDYDDNYDDEYGSYDDGDNDRDGIDDNEAITEIPSKSFVPSASEPKGFGEPSESEHPHRHHHGQETIGWKVEENIDEHDIVPVSNRQLENGINNASTSAIPKLTTTEQTSATQNLSSPTPSTVMMITTPKTPIDTATPVADLPPSKTSTIITTTMVIPSNVTEVLSTTGESIQTEVTPGTVMVTSTVKAELETAFSTVTGENETLSSTELTTLSNSLGIVTTSTEKQDNSTIDEILESTESPSTHKSLTQTSLISSFPTSTEIVTFESIVSSPTSTTSSTTTTTSRPTTEELITTPSTTTTITTPSTTTQTTTTTTTTATPSTTLTPELPKMTTEKIEYGVKNFPPRQDRRLKKIAVTAGKPLSYIIPANTFSDIEDGDTRNLQLSLLLKGHPVKNTHWLQFNRRTQEVYGLPLENDVSQWEYDIVASDREGLSVADRLDIYVQQHKFTRSVNHEFSIYLRIDKRSEFPTHVDWELKVVERLAQLYGDPDSSHITVRSIDIENEQAIFTWTNDSLPRTSECPKDEINKLLHVLIANKDGDPSAMLQEVLAPEIRVKRVVAQGIGQCENMNQPEAPKVPTEEPKTNFPPLPRNQVDHINATVGQLLVFRVPEDTFYDPEDGSARNMRMSLLTIDRTPIPPNEWLQFDSKNQEFYGVPLREDLRHPRREYQLVVTDKDGASATDGLVVVVHPAPQMRHSVEFSMTLDTKYETFAYSAIQKRNFIEKLRDLFGDRDTSAISLDSISEGSTVVTWRNLTLPTDHCPNSEIRRLKEVLVKPEKSLSERVNEIMGKDFPVQQITLIPMGVCLGELTGVHTPDSFIPPSEDSTSVGSSQDDYLITFILPAIIIATMVLLAGIIAFVLYRRRRSGKMSVSEHDDERQSFRSKGIPVIFQDELEEKPDPGNKSPVILKEEKPPLPPPEYQKSDDGADQPMLPKENSEEPYQPPPPFARTSDNNRQNRPKPTPTYRKPPPYVPP